MDYILEEKENRLGKVFKLSKNSERNTVEVVLSKKQDKAYLKIRDKIKVTQFEYQQKEHLVECYKALKQILKKEKLIKWHE